MAGNLLVPPAPLLEKTLKWLLLFLCGPALFASMFAQVREIMDRSAFGTGAALIHFTSDLPEDVKATNLFSAYGITFQGSGNAIPKIVSESSACMLQVVNKILRNVSSGEAAPGTTLTIDFRFPVQRVGLALGGTDAPSSSAALRAFDAEGRLMGQIDKNLTGVFTTCSEFSGFEATGSTGIARISIDYGSLDEDLVEMMVEYVTMPSFVSYLPQIVAGERFQTEVRVSNTMEVPGGGTLEFFDDGGNPLQVKIGDRTSDTFEFELRSFESTNFDLESMDGLQVGYARIQANVPVETSASFRALDSAGNLISEATIRSSNGNILLVGSAEKSRDGVLNTGIAIVNTSPESTTVSVSTGGFFGGTGSSGLKLKPGEHRALFLDQLIPSLEAQEYKGGIAIKSPRPVAVTLIRTFQGWPSAALPLGSAER